MEDGVGITMKDAACAGIVHALQTVDFGHTKVLAHINTFDAPNDLALHDLEAVLACPQLPHGIVIPKVTSAQDVWTISERLDALGDVTHNVHIVGMIESAQSVLNMTPICQAALHHFDVLVFGGNDYASMVGATRTVQGAELDFARNFILLQAVALGNNHHFISQS